MTSKIFFPFLCVLIVISIAGCVYQFGGASVYNATALTDEGKEFVKNYNVKYVCSDVYGLYLTDIIRSEGIFAIDIKTTKDGRIQYKVIDQKYVSQLGLIPKFSWWTNNGKFFVLLIFLIFIIICFFNEIHDFIKKIRKK